MQDLPLWWLLYAANRLHAEKPLTRHFSTERGDSQLFRRCRTEIIMNDFDGMRLIVTINNGTTDWQNLQKGIVTDCTLSRTSIFLCDENKHHHESCWERLEANREKQIVYQPLERVFMNLTITITTLVQTREVSFKLDEVIGWSKLKAKKSRCMIIMDGEGGSL